MIDNELKFNDHINYLCKKGRAKTECFTSNCTFMDTNKRTVMKAFAESQFSYCPLIWLCHSKGLNNKINRIHERALRITFNDKS